MTMQTETTSCPTCGQRPGLDAYAFKAAATAAAERTLRKAIERMAEAKADGGANYAAAVLEARRAAKALGDLGIEP